MRSFLTLSALASSILSTDAINLIERRDGSTSRTVQHKIYRRHIADPIQHDRDRLQRRQSDTVDVPLTNEQTLYFMSLSLGTPEQDVKLHIDTGSSDLWVNVNTNNICSMSGNPCTASGTYSANSSSTYQYVNSDFNISYVDGTGASGDYVADTVKFGGITLKNQIFGIGYKSNSQEGVLGIGYPSNEAAVKYDYEPYANVPANMVQNGYINSNAYSLWLDDLDASTGQIIFGGVDTDKYTGSLQTLPIVKTDGEDYSEFIIALTGIGLDGSKGSVVSGEQIGALLDSGSSLMYLPNPIAHKIYKEFNAQYDSSSGLAFADCSLANSDRTVDFTFSSPTIRVPVSEMLIQQGVENGEGVCILGIGLSGGSLSVLGDTFLRSAYVVYDIDNNEISIAQTDFSSTSDNIMEIGADSAVPSATIVKNAVTSVSAASGAAILGLSGSGNGAPAATAAIGYNLALLGAAGAAMFAL